MYLLGTTFTLLDVGTHVSTLCSYTLNGTLENGTPVAHEATPHRVSLASQLNKGIN